MDPKEWLLEVGLLQALQKARGILFRGPYDKDPTIHGLCRGPSFSSIPIDEKEGVVCFWLC